ncbi:MAG: primosomal protein N' [Nitrosomonas sp.]|nr:primosomal protein N' [Nitrosomonas sp.]
MPILRVALNIPIDTLFDYVAPEATQSDIGLRVCVPFGRRKLTGIIMEVRTETDVPAEKLKTIFGISREIPPLSNDLLTLFSFCSDYYHHPLGMVAINGLPVKLRNNKPVILKTDRDGLRYVLTESGRQVNASTIPKRNKVMHQLLGKLNEDELLSAQEVRKISSHAVNVLKEWVLKGWVEEKRLERPPKILGAVELRSWPELTLEQSVAVEAITAQFDQFHTWLLQGVTGSGKTEVYLRLIEKVLATGKQTLVLIPEINLTPQLEAVFHARFVSTSIVSLHSGLNDTERLRGWLEAQQGEARIILGTRLAVFTPLPDLGLVIVDEEHDTSFKQQDGLRYSARDLAVFRAKQAHIPVVLGSATPSLESYHNALTGRYRHLRLSQRAFKNAALPQVECVDMRAEKPLNGLSAKLIRAIKDCLMQQKQCLIFINRRGYAPVLMCQSCGWTAVCQRCSSRLVVHLMEKKLSCHHCGHRESFPFACPQCGDQDIKPFGRGTQRIEETFAELFPAARIMRIDRDSVSRKNAWQDILRAIHRNEVDILIGTQLLAKGHDFPNLSLVGILDSDVSLFSTDFRAGERLLAQLMQVSGRAGRAEIAGRVLIQTAYPDHLIYQAIRQHDYDVLAQHILSERKIAGFPPYVYQVLLRAEAHSLKSVIDFLSAAYKQAQSIVASDKSIEIFDPVPAAMTRLKGMERAHLLVQSGARKSLQLFLMHWRKQLNALSSHKVRWVLDVDPIEF